MLEVRRVTGEHAAGYFAPGLPDPEAAAVAYVDGKPVAIAGLHRAEGRVWAFLNAFGPLPAILAIRRMRDVLAEAHRAGIVSIYVTCEDRHVTAPRLLKLLGFQPTEEVRQGLRVYECRASNR